MRILVLHAHPDPESYNAALCRLAIDALSSRGHAIDLCDLYAEGFNPVLSRDERRGYHDVTGNTAPVRDHVDRLRAAEGLVLVHPVWNFGPPAILKGYLDRVFLPGVSFALQDGRVQGALDNIRKAAIVTTYGATRLRAFMAGDPPRKFATRTLRAITRFRAPVMYLAHYDMNRSTPETRGAFCETVRSRLSQF